MRQRLIVTARALTENAEPPLRPGALDVEFADAMARLESFNRHLYRPNNYLHKWWARRCGSTFRLILKQLVEDPERRGYLTPAGLEGKVVLDPMMGGGTTLHEAVRLGASVVGADIDPIPVLLARATLTPLPLAEIEASFEALHSRLRARFPELFRTRCPECSESCEARFMLYGLRRRCGCGTRICVDSFVLRHHTQGEAVRICASCRRVGTVACDCGFAAGAGASKLVEKATALCPDCTEAFVECAPSPYYARYEPVTVAGSCDRHGDFLRGAGEDDLERVRQADSLRPGLPLDPADFAVEQGPKARDLLRRGIRSYLDLFSSRQLLVMDEALRILPEFDSPSRLNLALLLSTSLEFNSMLCGYKGGNPRRPGAVRHTFSHHGYSFPYTALENNPLYPRPVSGSLRHLFETRVRKARRWAMAPKERIAGPGGTTLVLIDGEVDAGLEVYRSEDLRNGDRRFLLVQGSSASLPLPDGSIDYVVTDPPYYDSVQYADLAAFFRVWLRRMLPDAARWDYAAAGSAVHNSAVDERGYADLLGSIFEECRRVLKPEGRLIFTYHHWRPEAWAALTRALRRARFGLLSCSVVHSENVASVHITNQNALIHDLILTLCPAAPSTGGSENPPPRVDSRESSAFCRGCGRVLQWMLEQAELCDADLDRLWREAIQ